MNGAVISDIISSNRVGGKSTVEALLNADTLHFGDGTLMTVATADAILNKKRFAHAYRAWGKEYGYATTSGGYQSWMDETDTNDSNWLYAPAMRVSPIALSASRLSEAEREARQNASITHASDQAILYAEAMAAAIYLAKLGTPKVQIEGYLKLRYDMHFSGESSGAFSANDDESNAVEYAISTFIQSESFEDAIQRSSEVPFHRNVVIILAGTVAHAYYKTTPKYMLFNALRVLPTEFVQLIGEFNNKFKLDF